jgi:hypothetical protein
MTQSVKGTRTELNLKEAFAGESQANRRYLYLQTWQTWQETTTLLPCSVALLKVKLDTHMVTWNF